jgi:hypothetical protein
VPSKPRRAMTALVGRSRIAEMELWAQEDVELVATGFIEVEPDHMGSLGFIAVQGGIDWREAPHDGHPNRPVDALADSPSPGPLPIRSRSATTSRSLSTSPIRRFL